jgi:predicted lipoprotein with Yx(FWY)xxD motif
MNRRDPSSRPVHRTVVQPNIRRRSAGLAALVAIVLLVAACGDDNNKTQAGSGTTTGGDATTTTTEATPTAAAPVASATNATLGQILVDGQGRTVYVFDPDKDGKIACVDACASAWPPVVLEAGASLPTTGALAADLSTVARPDGAKQVAYKGRPVYRFAADAKAGDTSGDGKGGVWHVVKLGDTGAATATTVARVSPY